MPRIKPSSEQERKNKVNACIGKYEALRMTNNYRMAKATGISYETFCRRRRDPMSFSLREILALSKYLMCPMQELCGEEV